MKTLRILSILLFMTLFIACSSDDDAVPVEPTTQELLIGKWFIESSTSGGMTTPADACEQQTFVNFVTDEDLIIQSYYDSSGTCTTDGADAYPYSLTMGGDIVIQDGASTVIWVVLDISETHLTISSGSQSVIFIKEE